MTITEGGMLCGRRVEFFTTEADVTLRRVRAFAPGDGQRLRATLDGCPVTVRTDAAGRLFLPRLTVTRKTQTLRVSHA